MRNPTQRNEARIEFLGEQDGVPERELKIALESALADFRDVERAYLARIGFGPNQRTGIALCLAPPSKQAALIVRRVAEVFSNLFSRDAHLDVIFVSDEQELDLRRVCTPFFRRVCET